MITERQLHLFRSKRQRGAAVDYSPSEFEMHCAVADTLRRWMAPNWIWTHFPSGERRDTITGARLKRMGVAPGWPDFIFLPPANNERSIRGGKHARPHFLELKRRGGKLTEHQAAFALWCKLNDCPHAVADSYDAAVKILQGWGALMSRVHVQ